MQTLRVQASQPYDVNIGPGLLDSIEPLSEQAFVVSQPGSRSYAEKVARVLENQRTRTVLYELPDREGAKSLHCLEQMYNAAIEARLERSATVYAVGGGCVGDSAGFFAATYLRGVRIVHVPTTLVSMVDSGIGGKVGINVASTKNMAGAFWQPSRVVCDTESLNSLPKDEMKNGLAEAIKQGLILDANYFRFMEENMDAVFEKDPKVLEQVVAQSVRIKAEVVSHDERENGERMKLNYGHTVGHAVESITGLGHGHAIAIGMAVEGGLSEKLGYLAGKDLERQNRALENAGLPLKTRVSPKSVLEKMESDKKRANGAHTLVLLDRIGACHIRAVPEKDIVHAIQGACT